MERFFFFFFTSIKLYSPLVSPLAQARNQNLCSPLALSLAHTSQHFLQQINLAEQLTSSDFGVSTGLISQGYWEWSRRYFVNVERSQATDTKQPRNINISFNNNSNVPIDCLVFFFYSDEFVIHVETGIIEK